MLHQKATCQASGRFGLRYRASSRIPSDRPLSRRAAFPGDGVIGTERVRPPQICSGIGPGAEQLSHFVAFLVASNRGKVAATMPSKEQFGSVRPEFQSIAVSHYVLGV